MRTSIRPTASTSASAPTPAPRSRSASTEALLVVIAAACVVRVAFPGVLAIPTLQAWSTVFVAVFVQAVPYVVLGVALAAVLAMVPQAWLVRALPRRRRLAVVCAAMAGAAMPGCECGTVPVAATLLRRGAGAGPAVSFMLSAPATNPVVLAATAAAFPGRPRIVAARFVASLLVALVVGWCQARAPDIAAAHEHPHAGPAALAVRDLGRSLGLLTLGAASAATLSALVPQDALDRLAAIPLVGVVGLAILAVLLAVCSEADAFIASSLTQFSRVAQVTFMVVGPVVDVKLIAMQVGTFGARFAARLCVLTFVVAVLVAGAAGWLLLGGGG